jgi:hypothetical protein
MSRLGVFAAPHWMAENQLKKRVSGSCLPQAKQTSRHHHGETTHRCWWPTMLAAHSMTGYINQPP